MNVEFINPFLTSTKEVFQSFFGVETTVEKPYILDSVNSAIWEISAEMVYTGNVRGAFAIRMKQHLSTKLLQLSNVLYDNEEERSELLSGMVSEMANIIGSNASTQLVQLNINVSVPFIIQGKETRIPWPKNATTICIPFQTQYGSFVEIFCLKV